MQKKLIALALASAFAAPAFAATANVDVYGTASVSVDYVDGGSGGTASLTADNAESRARVSSNTSIIGFKGTEDLGGGLSAVWQIENAVAMDESGAFAGGRESFAGLSSKSLGSLTFGLRDTAHKLATGRLDVFGGGNQLADYRSLFGGVSNGSVRANNSVTYISPDMGGLVFRGTTAAMQEAGSSANPHLYSLSASYTAGPLWFTVAHEDMKFGGAGAATTTTTVPVTGTATGGVVDDCGGGTSPACTVTGTATLTTTGTRATMFGAGGNVIRTSVGGSAEAKQKNTRLGVGYTLGDLRLGAAWERTKVDVTAISGSLQKFGSGTFANASTDRDAWYLSAAYKLGANTLKAAYTRAGELDGLNNSGAQQWSIGVDNAMSKRTTVYALYTQVRNDNAAAYSLGGGPANTGTFQSGGGTGVGAVNAVSTGEDPRGFSIGMIHKF